MFSLLKKLDCYGLSFIGKRSSNQDKFVIHQSNGLTLLAVADGMGGAKGGEIASNIAIKSACKVIDETSGAGKKDLKWILEEIYRKADEEITKVHTEHSDLNGMGTTLSCALVKNDAFVCGNVGDSRVYHYNGDEFRKITEDHTYVEQYLKQFGPPVPQEAMYSSNIIYRAMTGEGDKPDIFPENEQYLTLKNGEALLLCSDGLIPDKSEDQEGVLKAYVTGFESLKESTEQLICNAYYSGSTDNITVIIASMGNLKRKDFNLDKETYPPEE